MAAERVTLHGMAHGGEAVGRLADGRVVFVAYTIGGETVDVEVVQRHRRWARGRLTAVVTASPDRVSAPCPYFAPDRCGGCRLQHIAADRQATVIRTIVGDLLRRVGRISDPPVRPTVRAGDYGYRSRARFAVDHHGALGFRRAGSRDIVPIPRCLLLDDATQELREAAGDAWDGATQVEVRTGSVGRALVVTRDDGSCHTLGDPVLVERVGGLEFTVSAASFFQANRAGAGILLDRVRRAAAAGPGTTALDLYAGVGLFARGLADDEADVVAVESWGPAVADARRNLAGLATVIHASAEAEVRRRRDAGDRVDVVVLDPPRRGAGAETASALAQVATQRIVYVSCDPAALARDARSLTAAGWRLFEAVPVDQFAQTAAIEVVATFVPAGT